MITKEGKILI